MTTIVISIIAVIVLLIILANIRIVPQASEDIIEFLGKYKTTWSAGIHFKIPFFERKDTLTAKQISVDIKTNGFIPTKDFIGVDIDAVAKVRVLTKSDISEERGLTEHMVRAAMKNFLNMKEEDISFAYSLFWY